MKRHSYLPIDFKNRNFKSKPLIAWERASVRRHAGVPRKPSGTGLRPQDRPPNSPGSTDPHETKTTEVIHTAHRHAKKPHTPVFTMQCERAARCPLSFSSSPLRCRMRCLGTQRTTESSVTVGFAASPRLQNLPGQTTYCSVQGPSQVSFHVSTWKFLYLI